MCRRSVSLASGNRYAEHTAQGAAVTTVVAVMEAVAVATAVEVTRAVVCGFHVNFWLRKS